MAGQTLKEGTVASVWKIPLSGGNCQIQRGQRGQGGGLFFTAGEDPRVCHLGLDFREGTILLTRGRGEVDPWKEKETEKEQSGRKEHGIPGGHKKPREPAGSATLGETGVSGERQGMGLEPDSAGLRKTGCLGSTLFAEGDR